jgi:hypothetical protein
MRTRSWRVTRLALALGSALIAVVPGVAGSGCEVATAPPADFRPMAVLPSYARWWSEVEACSRLTGDLTRVDWFEVQADSADGGFACEDGPDHLCAGEWAEPHYIYLAGPSLAYPSGYTVDEWTVKHEMLHDLVGRPGHPEQFDYCHLASRTPSGVYGLDR